MKKVISSKSMVNLDCTDSLDVYVGDQLICTIEQVSDDEVINIYIQPVSEIIHSKLSGLYEILVRRKRDESR